MGAEALAVDLDSPNCIEGSDNLLRLRWFDTRSQAPERIPVGITFRFDLFSIFFVLFLPTSSKCCSMKKLVLVSAEFHLKYAAPMNRPISCIFNSSSSGNVLS